MGAVTYNQTLLLVAGKTPVEGSAITEKDFEVFPGEVYSSSDYNESASGRVVLDADAMDVPLTMGTITTGHLLLIKLDGDVTIKVSGGSEDLKILGNRWSVLHVEFTALSVTNLSSSSKVEGLYRILGD
jgi:hypothetical protein